MEESKEFENLNTIVWLLHHSIKNNSMRDLKRVGELIEKANLNTQEILYICIRCYRMAFYEAEESIENAFAKRTEKR